MASSRQDVTRADRRAEVLRAAHEVFVDRGYARARIRDIAARAGVSEASVYRMFGTKSALFDAAARQPLERAATHLVEVAERLRASSRLGRYEQSYIGHEDLFAAMRGLAPMLASGPGRDGDSSPSLINEALEPVIEQLRGSVGEAMRGWAFEGGDPELVTEVLLGTYFWWALRARDGVLPSDPDDLHRRFVTLLMRAVQPRAAPIEFPRTVAAVAPNDRTGEPLGDGLWAALEPVLPPAPVGRGGRWRNHRQVLTAIAWKCRTGAAWRDLPTQYGSWQTAWNRLQRWRADGTWERLVAAAQDAGGPVAREAAWMSAAPGSTLPDGRGMCREPLDIGVSSDSHRNALPGPTRST